jgi:TetR/AcrR family transcriptional regulator
LPNAIQPVHTMTTKKSSRRQQILESLAEMLEANPGERITTARLAQQVGVSEAALYRHFPSKSKMFEGLIEFIEETLFSRIVIIVNEEAQALSCCEKILTLLLTFTERNPGITRILTGDALAGETERLRTRVAQLFDRIETQLKQVLREAEMREGLRPDLPIAVAANLLLATAEGRISQFVRSEFKRSPTENWSSQWSTLTRGFFRDQATLRTSESPPKPY